MRAGTPEFRTGARIPVPHLLWPSSVSVDAGYDVCFGRA